MSTPAADWSTAVGRTTRARADAVSRMVLPGATSLCLNTALRWEVDGQQLHGEDQVHVAEGRVCTVPDDWRERLERAQVRNDP